MSATLGNGSVTFGDGTVTSTNLIPSGTVMLFYQSAAPTGWTQQTTLNDYSIRIVNGTGGTTGGSTAFSSVFTNQTPSISVNVSGLSAGATTLSTAQIPSHTHGSYLNTGPDSGVYVSGYSNFCTTGVNYQSLATGGGGSHSHSISGSAYGSSSAITLNVLYANHILASKN